MVEKLAEVQAGLRYAFTVQPEAESLSIENVELRGRITVVIVGRGRAARRLDGDVYRATMLTCAE